MGTCSSSPARNGDVKTSRTCEDSDDWLSGKCCCLTDSVRYRSLYTVKRQLISSTRWRSSSPVIDVACGEAGTIFIDANGGAVAFNSKSERRPRRLMSTCVSQAAVGRQTALLIASSNLVQIDTPAWNTQRLITLPGYKAVAVACGAYHCLAATSCGELFAWGEGNAGQLGLGDDASHLKTFRNQPCHVRNLVLPCRLWALYLDQ